MLIRWRLRTKFAAALLLAASGTAQAYDPIVTGRGWHRVASFENGQCQAEVGTNGQFYVIAVYGMAPGERARLILSNEDMKPIDRTVHADDGGHWSEYYIPFLWHHENGTVQAFIQSASCTVPLEFEWQRRKSWDEKPPLTNPYRDRG